MTDNPSEVSDKYPTESLERSAKQLDRVLAFFPRVESKASFLFAVNSTLLGVLVVNIQRADFFSWPHVTTGAICVCVLASSMYFIYRCLFPNLAGGHASLVYFREIAKLREAEYIAKIRAVDQEQLADDFYSQVWRNSEILTVKFNAMKSAFRLTALSLLPWAFYLMLASVSHSQFPVLK